MGLDAAGEIYWSTYRYMLEDFVNKIKGRKGYGVFVSNEESIAQSRALIMIHEKSAWVCDRLPSMFLNYPKRLVER
jgi:hypothetical protein